MTSIGNHAFYYCKNLASIPIPTGVTSIEESAFEDCSSLTEITIPDGVTSIGKYTFEGCSSLTSITLPEGVTSIGRSAFSNTPWYNNLSDGVIYIGKVLYKYKGSMPENTTIDVKAGITEISSYAFEDCRSLTAITIPEGVTSIGDYAFEGCSKLIEVYCDATMPPSLGEDAMTSISSSAVLLIPEGSVELYESAGWKEFFSEIRPIANSLIASGTCGTNLTWKLTDEGELTIEGEGKMTGSRWWYDYATLIKKVIIEEGVTSIVSNAFYGCSNLSSIVIPESVNSVSAWAFEGCSKLVEVSVGSIEWWINYGGNSILCYLENNVNLYVGEELLTEAEIPSTITSIPSRAFRNCTNIVSVSIPESITAIGQGAFDNTGWYTNQPDGVLYIGGWLYGYKGEMPEDFELVVKDGIKGIVDYAFEDCANLIRVTIPESTQYIGDAAFIQSGLGLITMSEGVKSIGGGAFWGCYRLAEVSIPESVTEVGNGAFHNTAWYWKQSCGILYLSGWALEVKICGDCENCERMDYETANILHGIKGIAEGFTNFYSIVIPESVTYLRKAFTRGGAASIVCKSLVPPSDVDGETFSSIKNSSILYVPANAVNLYKADRYWGEFATIKAIDFPVWTLTSEGELIIEGSGAMDNYECERTPWAIYDEFIKSVTIKEGITSVGNNAFAYCEEMVSVSLPNSLQSIGMGAFAECDKLKSVVIPENVTTIGSGAFISAGLSSITCKSVVPPVVADWATFHYVSKSIPMYVPLSSIPSYRNAEYWNEFTNIQATPEYITINQYGSGTYCSKYALDFSEVEGLKAYAATGFNTETGIVTLTRVMTSKPGMGLFIKGEPGEYTVPVLEKTSDNSLNMLVGTLEQVKVNKLSDDGRYVNFKYTIYNDELKFWSFDGGFSLGAGKAYLQIPVEWIPAMEARSIGIRFDEGGTTDIEDVELSIQHSELIYDLMGRRVASPQKGNLYIINGKKVIY